MKSEFDLDPFQEAFFLFCGRRRDRIKALYWESDGFVMLYKRLKQGVYHWLRTDAESPPAGDGFEYRLKCEKAKNKKPLKTRQ